MKRGAGAALACGFVAVVIFLTGATSSRPVVNVCSWGEYIDTDLITQFEEETGIRVNYQTVESNETLYSLLKSGGADYDVVVPSDYMIAKLLEEDMLEELDYGNIPNFSLIDDRFNGVHEPVGTLLRDHKGQVHPVGLVIHHGQVVPRVVGGDGGPLR